MYHQSIYIINVNFTLRDIKISRIAFVVNNKARILVSQIYTRHKIQVTYTLIEYDKHEVFFLYYKQVAIHQKNYLVGRTKPRARNRITIRITTIDKKRSRYRSRSKPKIKLYPHETQNKPKQIKHRKYF